MTVVMPEQSIGDWRPLPATPPDGWSFEDLLKLDLPKHTELIRGALVMSPQKRWHMWLISRLWMSLNEQVPADLSVEREMAVRRSKRTFPEPDLCVVRVEATGADVSWYDPADVLLAVEAVSPESEERDRQDKPRMYAEMGISGFWLVERDDSDLPVIYEHRLLDGRYSQIAVHRERLRTAYPFSIDVGMVDLTKPLRS